MTALRKADVWTGKRAISVEIVDRTGTLQDAVDCAARMAKLKTYRTREYPEKKSLLEELLNSNSYVKSSSEEMIKEKIGAQQYDMLQHVKKLQDLMKAPQSRLPFDIKIY